MKAQSDYRHDFRSYVKGLVLALILSCLAFALVAWQLATPTVTLWSVFGLALLQGIAHFRYFMHVDLRKSVREDLQLILFASLIVLLMVGGTLVIMFNLRHRMM
ncbi:cytochrome C oxidase subunit IV family protein [Polaromonas sp. CG_9.11]|uniref:cytochrome o ubiquinol oxidase subunit IV n=1 Tax=Polaromonas sp. CG_9.11 TaxID=2787730 RepID=UPI0018C9AF02